VVRPTGRSRLTLDRFRPGTAHPAESC